MKIRFTILFVLIAISLFGQDDILTKQLTVKRDILDCETITLNAVDILSENLKTNNIDTFNLIVNLWIKSCGKSECSQRLIILKAIIDNETSIDLIKEYFENNFHYVIANRISDSKRSNYGYLYADNKSYYGFVPLRHTIDSVTMSKSKELIESKNLTADEKLICILFSGDIELSEKEIKKNEYKDSYIRNYVKDENLKHYNSWLAYNIYTGIYSPLGTKEVFSYSPILGLTFSSPLHNKLLVELGIKFRFNTNDEDFQFYALGDTNTVNSDVSVFFGGLLGYKIYDKNNLILLPKFGIGLESVSTGLSKEGKTSDDKDYFDVETIHLSLGLSAMRQIFRRNYIGLELSYHYCPFQSVEDLHTTFNNNSFSAEIFFRF